MELHGCELGVGFVADHDVRPQSAWVRGLAPEERDGAPQHDRAGYGPRTSVFRDQLTLHFVGYIAARVHPSPQVARASHVPGPPGDKSQRQFWQLLLGKEAMDEEGEPRRSTWKGVQELLGKVVVPHETVIERAKLCRFQEVCLQVSREVETVREKKVRLVG
eukprot:CAMPEP_0175156850 /NCGR_PEP_ID=MMETSP0087-20121206/21850_2 /TAXON_ID=136419 /ORGANISM="Unknown Unknown, Strain D1" /LENGTH=161 /DNA_ID=CAMNT_0016444343 /DNA_START=222 /DNA_END=707 /DNA_ORIENTATION=-